MPIHAIDKCSVQSINSAQVITDLCSAVKELVENAIDSGATAVDIKLEDHGASLIEVADNGSGIAADDYEFIALRSHTSKLSDFADLDTVTTLGFRGEALNSLCNLTQFSVETATAETVPKGQDLSFDPSGVLIGKKAVARKQGTTVRARNLFHRIPVRQRDLVKNGKREYTKAVALIHAYALSQPAVRFSLSHKLENKPSSVVFRTLGKGELSEVYNGLFGGKSLAEMIKLELDFEIVAEKSVLRLAGLDHASTKVHITGLISKPGEGAGRSTSDRQYFFINGRPFNPSKLQKAFNETYKQFNLLQYPSLVLNFQVPPQSYDVNVSPDKRSILFHSEANLLEALKTALNEFLFTARSRFDRNVAAKAKQSVLEEPNEEEAIIPKQSQRTLQEERPFKKRRLDSSSDLEEVDSGFAHFDGRLQLTNASSMIENEVLLKASSTLAGSSDAYHDAEADETIQIDQQEDKSEERDRLSNALERNSHFRPETIRTSSENGLRKKMKQTMLPFEQESIETDDDYREPDEGEKPRREGPSQPFDAVPDELWEDSDSSSLGGDTERLEETFPLPVERPPLFQKDSSNSERFEQISVLSEDIGSQRDSLQQDPLEAHLDGEKTFSIAELPEEQFVETSIAPSRPTLAPKPPACASIPFNLQSIKDVWKHREEKETIPDSDVDQIDLKGASIEDDQTDAEAALSRTIEQQDFKSMQICGQFNLGFIIARRIKKSTSQMVLADDLFIVDQHASDEKYNFECLQASTKLDSQRELIPRTLDLSAMDELVAIEHVGILRANGYDIQLDEDAPSGQRVKLIGHPVSKTTVFGLAEFDEILSLIKDNPNVKMVRPAKVRSMLASRACRKSVMIGQSLKPSQMRDICTHMASMKHPWSCPHGRPTMRWLLDLREQRV